MPLLNGTELGVLPTMGVGSYASPGWLTAMRRALRAGSAGPADLEEAVLDAVRVAVCDQEEAGLDILSDGEIRRQRFLWNVVEKLSGLSDANRRLLLSTYNRTVQGGLCNDKRRSRTGRMDGSTNVHG